MSGAGFDVKGYDVEVRWSWGHYHRFHESKRFHVRDKADIEPYITAWLPRMVERYAFDCGRVNHPLDPHVYQIIVTPIAAREYLAADHLWPEVERLIEQRRAALSSPADARKGGAG